MRKSWPLLLVLSIGCEQGDDATTDTDTDTTGETDTNVGETDTDTTGGTLALEDVITVTTPAVGDLTCVPEDGTSWVTQQVSPDCVEDVPLQGTIEDFQTGDAVVGMQVEIFFGDRIEGEADVHATSDVDGVVTGGNVPTCTAWASRATNPSDPEAPPAIQMHWNEGPASPMDAYFNAVDSSTLGLMGALLGTTPDPAMGVAAGTIYTCEGEGHELENVQIVMRAEDGSIPARPKIHYFVDEFPNRTQPATSEDGLFLVVDVPPGDYTIEAYGVLATGEAPTLIAKTKTQILAGSLTVSDVYSGSGDGVVLDAACTASCAAPTVR